MEPNENDNHIIKFLSSSNFSPDNPSFQNSQFSNPQDSSTSSFSHIPPFSYNQDTQNHQYSSTQFGDIGSGSTQFGGSGSESGLRSTPRSGSTNTGRYAIDLNTNAIEVQDACNSNWTWDQDQILISAWLNTSMDSVKGTDQKLDTFWGRIQEYCQLHRPDLSRRNPNAIKHRWHKISKACNTFGSCYDCALRNRKSGASHDDVIEIAIEDYKIRAKEKNFKFLTHWNILKNQPKWKSPSNSSGGPKRTKTNASGAYSTSSNNDHRTSEDVDVESPVRPIGVKAAKRKSKGKSKVSGSTQVEEKLEEVKSYVVRKLSLIESIKLKKDEESEMNKKLQEKTLELREMEIKQKDCENEKAFEMQVLNTNTSTMDDDQKLVHKIMLEKVKARYL